jgi:hypothetical protein
MYTIYYDLMVLVNRLGVYTTNLNTIQNHGAARTHFQSKLLSQDFAKLLSLPWRDCPVSVTPFRLANKLHRSCPKLVLYHGQANSESESSMHMPVTIRRLGGEGDSPSPPSLPCQSQPISSLGQSY